MVEHTRVIRHQNNVYKVRASFEESSQISKSDIAFEKLEPVIRAVLYAEERGRLLRLVDTKEVTVSCAKKYWKASEKLGFKQNGKTLEAYPYMLLFDVRLKTDHEVTGKGAKNSRANGAEVHKGYTSDNTNNLISEFNQKNCQPVVELSRVSLQSCNHQKNNHDTPNRRSARNVRTPSLVIERLPEKRKQSTHNIESENSNSSAKKLRFTREDRHNSISPGKKPQKISGVEDLGKQPESELCDNQLHQSTVRKNSVEAMVMSPIVPKLTEKLRSSRSQRITSVTPQRRGKRTESLCDDSPRLSSTAFKNQRKSPRLLNREAKNSPGPNSPRRATHRRASSGFWRLMETLLTPVKLLTGRRSK
ncbi:uncharacterized protein [Haliotis asinina]|uniref:uncharacterized protein n=1 Tax=Haliotis asinina TaxID=109174 RepID=UPI0035326853